MTIDQAINIDETINVMLKEYPDFMRFLRSGEFEEPNLLRGILSSDPNWSYSSNNDEKAPVNHFTLTESAFAHNQMGYTTIAYMAQTGLLKGVKQLPLEVMNEKKFNAMLITKYDASFRKGFPSAEPFVAEFEVVKQSCKRAASGIYLFTNNNFKFEGGKVYGTSRFAIHLDEHELE